MLSLGDAHPTSVPADGCAFGATALSCVPTADVGQCGTSSTLRLSGVDPRENASHTRIPMRVAILTASLAALVLGAWAAEAAAPIPPTCSALDTQRHATLRAGGRYPQSWYERYCGPGRAVARVGGKSFTIEGGNCSGNLNRRSFGLVGYRVPGKGFWFRLAPVVTHSGRERWFVRPGRVDIIDGQVRLPGFDYSLANQGTAIISKDLKSATFSVGSPPRVTGSWRCR